MESIRVEIRVDRELLSEIDDARGIAARGTWLKWAVRRVLAERSGASPVAEVNNVRALPGVELPPVAQPEPEPAREMPAGLRHHGGRRDVTQSPTLPSRAPLSAIRRRFSADGLSGLKSAIRHTGGVPRWTAEFAMPRAYRSRDASPKG